MNSMWRYTGGTVKFMFIDSRAAIFLIIFLYSISIKTFIICAIGVTVLGFLEYKGYTIPNAMRRLRVMIFGKNKEAVPTSRMSRPDR